MLFPAKDARYRVLQNIARQSERMKNLVTGESRLLDDPDIDRTAVDLLYNPIVIDTFAHICNLDIAKSRQK